MSDALPAHARLSASQTKRWANCPGSVAYLEKYPNLEEPSGYHAMLGTAAHALAEHCLREGSEVFAYEDRLIEITNPGSDNEGTKILSKRSKMPKSTTRVVFIVDQEMIDAVSCMTRYVYKRCVELGLMDHEMVLGEADWASEVAALVKNGTVRLEERVVPLPERNDTGGTGDVIIDAWPDVLEIVDYKNGSGIFVPVDMNDQLRSYALGALQSESADYDVVRYTICQPRHLKAPEDGIMYEETTVEELFIWKNELAMAASQVDEARVAVADGAGLADLFDAGFISAGKDGNHCTFCPIMGHPCPAAQAAAEAQCIKDFEDEPMDMLPPTDEDALARILVWAPFLTKFLKEVEEKAETYLMAGGTVPGKKLVHGRSTRRWATSDEKAIIKLMVDEYGAQEEDLYSEPKFITGPQAEKLVPKDQRKDFNSKMLDKPAGRITMVDESDKKPAVVIGGDAVSDFEDLED